MTASPVIQVENLVRSFVLGDQTVHAVDNISFTVSPGEMVSISGPSGSGKSTLLGLLGGLDHATSGRIVIDGTDITSLNETALTRLRNRKIGFVFQFYNLLGTLTALENVALPIRFAAERRHDPVQRATELLSRLGLADRLHHRPNQLSGGQQQRVAIARALANNPPLLLADEPTGNLNTEAGDLVMRTLHRVREEFGTTIVLVTHDPRIADQADRTLLLVDGKIAALSGRESADV
jgi:putative ABC transport system ATP-binding protein